MKLLKLAKQVVLFSLLAFVLVCLTPPKVEGVSWWSQVKEGPPGLHLQQPNP